MTLKVYDSGTAAYWAITLKIMVSWSEILVFFDDYLISVDFNCNWQFNFK